MITQEITDPVSFLKLLASFLILGSVVTIIREILDKYK